MQRMAFFEHKIKINSTINYLLPLTFLSLMGASVSYLSIIFNTNVRWVIFYSLFLFILTKRRLFWFFDKELFFALSMYILWCFLTSFWSEAPSLSFAKTILLSIVVYTMLSAGIEWVLAHSWQKSLDYFWLIATISLLSGYFGKVSKETYSNYDGLFGNANMFGILLAMSLPLFLWKNYISWSQKYYRYIYCFFTISCIYYLVLTISRAAFLVGISILFAFILSLRVSKKIGVLYAISFFMIGLLFVNPSLLDRVSDAILERYILKARVENTTLPPQLKNLSNANAAPLKAKVLSSRMTSWRESYEAAQDAGWFGAGYAVSKGNSNFHFQNGLSSTGYGREKGNSQLSIIEETGQIGLIFYLYFMFVIFKRIINLYITVKGEQSKVLVGLIGGLFIGMILHSMFEAWWDAPGSPEASFFWTLVGVVRGLEILLKLGSNQEEIHAIYPFKAQTI